MYGSNFICSNFITVTKCPQAVFPKFSFGKFPFSHKRLSEILPYRGKKKKKSRAAHAEVEGEAYGSACSGAPQVHTTLPRSQSPAAVGPEGISGNHPGLRNSCPE